MFHLYKFVRLMVISILTERNISLLLAVYIFANRWQQYLHQNNVIRFNTYFLIISLLFLMFLLKDKFFCFFSNC